MKLPFLDFQKQYRVGTLLYTPGQLLAVCAWMLCGALAMNLIMTTFNIVIPVLMNEQQISNQAIIFVSGSLLHLLNSFMNPLISYSSDRTRSRWGRRKPYIFFTAPLYGGFLILFAFVPELSSWLSGIGWFSRIAEQWLPGSIPVSLFIFAGAGFFCSYLFVGSVYYYLIPDVLPQEVIGRYYSYFYLLSYLTAAGFNLLLMPLIELNYRGVLIGVGLAYPILIGLMCLMVREGEYPPLDSVAAQSQGWRWWPVRIAGAVKTYVRECFMSSYYWMMFLWTTFFYGSTCGGQLLLIFCRDDLGIPLTEQGRIGAGLSVLAFLNIPLGILVDKIGGFRITIWATAAGALLFFPWFFMLNNIPTLIAYYVINLVLGVLLGVAKNKVQVEVFDREKFGQLASAQALFSSVAAVLFNVLIAYCFDFFGSIRIFFIWRSVMMVFALFFCCVLFRIYTKQRKTNGQIHCS